MATLKWKNKDIDIDAIQEMEQVATDGLGAAVPEGEVESLSKFYGLDAMFLNEVATTMSAEHAFVLGAILGASGLELEWK